MKKVRVLLVICGISIADVGAQDWSGGWRSEYGQGACYLTAFRIAPPRIAIPEESIFVDNPDYDPALEASNVGFITVVDPDANPFFEDRESPVEVGSLVFWLTFPRDAGETFSERRNTFEFSPVQQVWIDDSPASKLADIPNSPFLEFLLEGPEARDLWDQLYRGGQLLIEAQKEDESRGSFVVADIPTADFRLRADQFEACVAAMVRDIEMHKALPNSDEPP